jgi:hypothetical protein
MPLVAGRQSPLLDRKRPSFSTGTTSESCQFRTEGVNQHTTLLDCASSRLSWSEGSCTSQPGQDVVKVPRTLIERLANVLCHAAQRLKST